MSGKHTPGPWTVRCSSKGYPYQIEAPNGSRGPGGITCVTRWAAISFPTSTEGQANARLIAAAPDMFAILQDACRESDANPIPRGPKAQDMYDRAMAIIAKVEGRS